MFSLRTQCSGKKMLQSQRELTKTALLIQSVSSGRENCVYTFAVHKSPSQAERLEFLCPCELRYTGKQRLNVLTTASRWMAGDFIPMHGY